VCYLGFQSIGVVYGDIGTSPLYVFSSTFTSQPSYQDLVGALSIIIWTLTLLVSIKYAFIVLEADVCELLVLAIGGRECAAAHETSQLMRS
jgi:K+ transporter